ncbi:MAG: nitrile hydratase subunit beta [Pseudomonadota bacterium]
MNGAHDVGGMQSFGKIEIEADGPNFHADWERRAFALTLAAGALGQWTLDQSRHARESLEPGLYYTSSYYRIWLEALERLLLDAGMVTEEELAAGTPQGAPLPTAPLRAKDVPNRMKAGSPVDRPPEADPRFAVGGAVRAKTMHPQGHTRLPRYARGKLGTIAHIHGCHLLPDSHAHGGDRAEWLYSVAFDHQELWGPDAKGKGIVMVDLWESYLEPA